MYMCRMKFKMVICVTSTPVRVGYLSHAAQGLKFKIPLLRSYVPCGPIEHMCQVSSTSAQWSWVLKMLTPHGWTHAWTDISPVLQVISIEMSNNARHCLLLILFCGHCLFLLEIRRSCLSDCIFAC